MVLTIFGLLVAGVGLLMLIFKRPLRDFLSVLLICSVLGSAEAVALPMLGGASLAVPYFFVAFVILRMFLMAHKNSGLFFEAIRANLWIVVYAIYGLLAAMLFPRFFEGQMSVITMRPMPFATLLTFTSQNITQSMYICLTSLTALASYSVARMSKSEDALTWGWIISASAYLLFALVDLAGFYGGLGGLMDWARTASYQMVAQSEMGVKRISGSFSEPSSFATFGAAPLLYFSLLWLMNQRSSISGPLALALAVILGLSTSSTAYVLLAVTLLIVVGGVVVVPMKPTVRRKKFMSLCVIFFAGVFAAIGVAMFLPAFTKSFLDVFESMTVGKVGSGSAMERGSWAAQGFTAFNVSRGLGIGPGSFRSSGIAQAIIGSVGVVGAVCASMYLLRLASAIWQKRGLSADRIASAATITSLAMLTPSLLVGAAPDLGILFGVMAGFALGRHQRAKLMARANSVSATSTKYSVAPPRAAPA